MQSVADRWYILYHRVSLVLGSLLALATITTYTLDSFRDIGEKLGLSGVVLVIVIIQLGYSLVPYKQIISKYGYAPATLLILVVNSLGILALMQATGGLDSPYTLLWGAMVLAAGMFGTYALVAGIFIITSYFVVSATSLSSSQQVVDVFAFMPLFGTIVLATASHYLWRHAYENQETKKVAQLSGMLKNKQQQAEVLIQSLADGIILTSTDGKIVLINQIAATMTGWSIDEAVGIDAKLVVKFHAKDGKELPEQDDPFVLVTTNKQPASATVRVISKDNKETVVSVVASPILTSDGSLQGTVAVLRDISAGFKEEEQRAEFISTASHEMRTPVAAIEGYLALALNERVSKIDPKARSFLEKAHESTQHLGQLFQDLLTSAKAEDGRLVSHPQVIEIGEYLEALADSLRFAAQKKGLLSDFMFGTSSSEKETSANQKVVKPLYYVYADPDRLREVITNLFDNAVKYTPEGKITLGLTGNKDIVQIFVRDTGNGIPKEDIPHLFQKFYRVDNSSTRTIGGTGLGLFICRKIIELYHGRIWVESEYEKGSTFYINLPRLTAEKAASLQQKQAQGLPAIGEASI